MASWLLSPQNPVVVGMTGHTTDHNDIASDLATLWASATQGIINVMSPAYGAVGDGTTDDTAAIQAAMNAVPTNGGVVFFAPGYQFKITSSLSASVTGTILMGGGWGSNIRYDGNVVSPAIKAATNIRVFVRDLRITQTNASALGTAIDASNFNTSVIERCLIDGSTAPPKTGILINSATAFYNCVRDCRISYGGASSAGISIQGGANSTVVDNVRLVPTSDDAASSGIYISGSHSITVTRPDVESGNGNGTWLDTGAHGVTITSGYLEAMNIGLKISSGVQSPTVLGCTIQGNTTANVQDNGSINPFIINAWPNSGTNGYSSAALTQVAAFSLNGVPVPATTYQPSDVGLLAWTYDPSLATNSTLTTAGTVYLAQVQLRYAQTISKLAVGIAVAASGVTANQNFLGLYDSGGTLRASTAAGAIDASIASAGFLNASVATPYAAPAGTYWVALLCNATTMPTLARATGSTLAIPNAGAAAASMRYAVNGTGRITLAASITPASNTASGAFTMWAGVD